MSVPSGWWNFLDPDVCFSSIGMMHCDILMIRWMRWPLRGYTAELCITYCTTSLNTIKMYWKHFKTLFGQAEPPAVRRLARCKKSAKASPDSWHVNCDKPTCSLCHIVSLSLSTYLYVYIYNIYIHNDTTIYIYVHIYPVYMCKHTKVKKHAVLKNVGTQAT